MARREGGFTLIEILVVVTIIGVLMGMVALIAPLAFKRREETTTQTRVQKVAVAITQLANRNALGWYPPTGTENLRDVNNAKIGKDLGPGNEFNRGIETAVIALHLNGLDVTIDLEEDALRNWDGDQMPGSNPTRLGTNDRWEIVDAWRVPLAYFSSADYKKPDAYKKIQLENGDVIEVKPWIRKKTGLFVNPDSFQLFSAGPDGIFNTPDDMGNWESSRQEDEEEEAAAEGEGE